ncbi:MAG: SUMF1/EgtB/PvdO family nonheme iron enzyme [Bacteroidota bacterium]
MPQANPFYPPMTPAPLKTFVCYAHEDRTIVKDLLKHLRPLAKKDLIEIWDDGQILPGQDWDKAIKLRLESAQLILMFVSVDFIDSEYIEKKELKAALERHTEGEATLVPIIVRACGWKDYFDIGRFQALPKEALPIMSKHFPILDDALDEVAQGIRLLVTEMQHQLAAKAEAARLEQAEKEKAEKQAAIAQSQQESLRKQDEAAWEAAKEAAENIKDERGKIAAYRVYLDDPEHVIHRVEAEKAIENLKKAEINRKIKEDAIEREKREKQEAEAEKKRLAEEVARREAEARKRQEAEAEKKRLAEEVARREAEARKKQEAEAEKKRLAEEAARQKGLPEMVFVKGGTFQMGSDEIDHAKPIHAVTLSDFEIGKYPVTQKLWQEIMGDNPSYFKENENCPVEEVSWEDTQAFLKKLNTRFPDRQYRLPTEAEWEYAARGGVQSKGFQYAGSDILDEVAWHNKNAGLKTHPVGIKKANELGIYDMSGNVWEWCSDWHGAYTSGSQTNPHGPASGSGRVLRGGSWYFYPLNCRVADRSNVTPTFRNNDIGFRLARTI